MVIAINRNKYLFLFIDIDVMDKNIALNDVVKSTGVF